MGKVRRVVDTSFWNDEKVGECFTPEDKLFMLYLLTNPHSTQLGIYPITPRVMAFELGYSPETVRYLIERFQDVYGIIRYSRDTNEIAIKNFLRHSIIKGGKPVEDLLRKEMRNVINKDLIKWVFTHLDSDIQADRDINYTVQRIVSTYFGKPFKKENQKQNDNGNERQKQNDNDESYHESLDESYHESLDESYHESSEEETPAPIRKKYGEFDNVLLSDEEYRRFSEKVGERTEWYISRLSYHMQSTGKTYADHMATMLSWWHGDMNGNMKGGGNGNGTNGTRAPINPALDYAQRTYTDADFGPDFFCKLSEYGNRKEDAEAENARAEESIQAYAKAHGII